jgi:hypothetical protein
MSKYFSLFQTEAQWQAAQDSLDYPNVSLIDTTGDVHYSTYLAPKVADAPFGNILMEEKSSGALFHIEPSTYNLTDYPLEQFEPIAVCIYDRASRPDNLAVFLSVKYMSPTSPETGADSTYSAYWGDNTKFSEVPGINSLDTTGLYTSKMINDGIKELVTVDWSGSTIPNNANSGSYPVFEICWRYHTVGTKAGDWMLPNFNDLAKFKNNFNTIKGVFQTIRNVAGNEYPLMSYFWYAYEKSASDAGIVYTDSSFSQQPRAKNNASTVGIRAVMYSGVQKL